MKMHTHAIEPLQVLIFDYKKIQNNYEKKKVLKNENFSWFHASNVQVKQHQPLAEHGWVASFL